MKPAAFAYHRPTGLDHALDLLRDLAAQGGRILAGGQSLVPLMALRLAQPPHLIDINDVAFAPLRVEAGALCIPATTRHRGLAGAPALAAPLARVAAHIAHLPIRTRGTFCGSLAHADPAAEWPLVFTTLGGWAVAQSVAGQRRIAAEAFLLDIMTTALAEDELLVEAQLPLPPPGTRFGFYEISRRAGDYAMAMAFVTLCLEGDTITAARVGVGGAERRPRRIAQAEALLVGARYAEDTIRAAADACAAAIDPMEDAQVTADLRRDLVRAATCRALRRAA